MPDVLPIPKLWKAELLLAFFVHCEITLFTLSGSTGIQR